ncbi:MAG: ATP-binding cassette domain-containing protein, partial [Mesorhizobium sp.]
MTQPWAEALTISGLDCFYGEVQVLYGLDLVLNKGEVLCLFGRNGAGKTTTLKAIMGILSRRSGSVTYEGRETIKLPSRLIAQMGIAYCPEE